MKTEMNLKRLGYLLLAAILLFNPADSLAQKEFFKKIGNFAEALVDAGGGTQSSGSQSTRAKKHITYEYVDLGVSVMWATCNIGASKPTEYGDYFAWAETSPKDDYSTTNSTSRGNYFNDIEGDKYYDAAVTNCGGEWRMPTKSEWVELRQHCDFKWTTINGVCGYVVISKENGNEIFLPAAGQKNSKYQSGTGKSTGCLYWTSNPDTQGRDAFVFNGQKCVLSSRSSGIVIRPVMEIRDLNDIHVIDKSMVNDPDLPNDFIEGHKYVDLGLSVKWATCNIGARKPSYLGNYFSWGETSTKEDFDINLSTTYNTEMGDISGNKYNDAATSEWGGTWRMPTLSEWEELKNKCNWEWTNYVGAWGYLVTSKENGNSIFLPSAGRCYNKYRSGLEEQTSCYYWTSTPASKNTEAWSFNGGSDAVSRSCGIVIRPVSE